MRRADRKAAFTREAGQEGQERRPGRSGCGGRGEGSLPRIPGPLRLKAAGARAQVKPGTQERALQARRGSRRLRSCSHGFAVHGREGPFLAFGIMATIAGTQHSDCPRQGHEPCLPPPPPIIKGVTQGEGLGEPRDRTVTPREAEHSPGRSGDWRSPCLPPPVTHSTLHRPGPLGPFPSNTSKEGAAGADVTFHHCPKATGQGTTSGGLEVQDQGVSRPRAPNPAGTLPHLLLASGGCQRPWSLLDLHLASPWSSRGHLLTRTPVRLE